MSSARWRPWVCPTRTDHSLPGYRAGGPLPGLAGLGCPRAGSRRAARLRVRGDNIGAQLPGDRGPGRKTASGAVAARDRLSYRLSARRKRPRMLGFAESWAWCAVINLLRARRCLAAALVLLRKRPVWSGVRVRLRGL